MKNPLVLVSHFRNEKFLICRWLMHHKRIFDHGIMIDYNSDDGSTDIIREICPTWQIIPARNDYFGAREADAYVTECERDIENEFGKNTWKIALNTTEFLFHENPKAFLENYPDDTYKPMGITMVDHPKTLDDSIYLPDLFSQKTYGYFDPHHGRLLHRKTTGEYDTGRHRWKDHDKTKQTEDMFILWFGWCPMRYILERKLAIQYRIPDHDKQCGFGYHHHVNENQLWQQWQAETDKSYDLLTKESYKERWLKFHSYYQLGHS